MSAHPDSSQRTAVILRPEQNGFRLPTYIEAWSPDGSDRVAPWEVQ